MIVKHYSKMALVALAVASLTFASCGGKNTDSAVNNQKMLDSKQAEMDAAAAQATADAAAQATADAAAQAAAAENMVAKPSTNSVYFTFDSAKIDDAGSMVLVEYAAWLNANVDVSVTIEGNCDERGSREYNLALGDKRANAVRDVLVANGVAEGRVVTVSFGEERPACSGTGEVCWAQNRHGDVVNH